MPAPFLRLLSTPSWGSKNLKVVLAASGPSLFCFNSADGTLLSRWSHISSHAKSGSGNEEDGIERPSKRQRLSTEAEDEDLSDAPSPVVTVDDPNAQKPRRKKKKALPLPSVIKLTASSDGKHVVVVTNEDKTIRVLEMLDGQLRQLSERQMPKKPGAVALTPDQRSILAADKFGDVYALPLTFSDKLEGSDESQAAAKEPEVKPYKPSATNLTVHTAKNLRSLEQQLSMKNRNVAKKSYDFEHRIVLGHVSLLTDLIALTHVVEGKKRSYILTADRDEHIRVTRGIPQTHVIENFCLGHTSFVNKMIIPATVPNILISGGGDDYLLLWDWVHGKLLSRTSLLEHVNAIRLSRLSIEVDTGDKTNIADESKIAVTGIWSIPVEDSGSGPASTHIVVACESVPAMLVFKLEGIQLRHIQNLELEGNPLDIVVDDQKGAFMVSIDNVHQAGSTSKIQSSQDRPYVQAFTSSAAGWQPGGALKELEQKLNGWAITNMGIETDLEENALASLLYGAEHLRKRYEAEAEIEADGEGEAEAEEP